MQIKFLPKWVWPCHAPQTQHAWKIFEGQKVHFLSTFLKQFHLFLEKIGVTLTCLNKKLYFSNHKLDTKGFFLNIQL